MSRRWWGAGIAVVVLLAGFALAATVARPVASATTADGIGVQCTGLSDAGACEAWADVVLADGPGIRVFDPDDLGAVRLVVPLLGIGECRAEYVLGRYPDEVAASETVDCPDA